MKARIQSFVTPCVQRRIFAVSQMDVLNAQVNVEAAHRSAVNGGIDYTVARSEELDEYERLCQQHQLFDR